jgi:hypothetical protein
MSVDHVYAGVARDSKRVGPWCGLPGAGGPGSGLLSTSFHDQPRHTASANTITSSATAIQINVRRARGDRGVSTPCAFV